MGDWVCTSVLVGAFILVFNQSFALELQKLNPKPVNENVESQNSRLTERSNTRSRSLAKPILQPQTASSNLENSYPLIHFSPEDAIGHYPGDLIQYHVPDGPQQKQYQVFQDFNSIENNKESYNADDFQNQGQFLDTSGYSHYESQNSFNLEGPKQVEFIKTDNYHKEVEPYSTEDFQKHHHKEEEEHAEVHYHQHKHLHKHKHKQDHMHKHKEEHKEEHKHKHEHKAEHKHKHEAQHKHQHMNEHWHKHKNQHMHKHKQEHKHQHKAEHKHEHKQKAEHKHEQKHKHNHEHWNEHKHKHEQQHKHEHKHEHKAEHNHKHEHKENGKHKHEHKHEHKHDHKEKHKHIEYKHKP